MGEKCDLAEEEHSREEDSLKNSSSLYKSVDLVAVENSNSGTSVDQSSILQKGGCRNNNMQSQFYIYVTWLVQVILKRT